ncbi:hypothetical protein KL911_003102 [Ogataea haglerorum]|uniref:uncharacterized protein n=1 Tax=Ogataea haglerorum TaxID=1937702 RepID=UPI001C88E4A5|nr:uncharacterized protein KL911_003102 [Ogataea haglerorum]KAG7747329.1 hypothetical protein KL912_003353 [Ogataea haglerorum]KAG7752997.1 hypothetical protein KL911_003102 [Ogataea haglerorum]
MESKRRVHGTAQRQKTELCVRGSVLVQPDVYADPYDQVADVARLGHHRVKTLAIHEVLELVAVVEQREDHYAPGGPDQPLQHALLLGRGDLGDDQKNHAVDRPGAEALDRSGDYEHQHRLGRAAQNTAQAEHGQGDQHDGLSSAALGGLAADRDHRGLGQSERSAHPGGRTGIVGELGGYGGKCNRDDCLVESGEENRHHEAADDRLALCLGRHLGSQRLPGSNPGAAR